MPINSNTYVYKKGLVSIAIPAYKQTFLAEAIDSALGQDYDDIELIIVNDNSPYDLDNIVRRYDDKRIRYFKNKRNLGRKSVVLNWNRCLDHARGEFFVLLCDDDILMPDFVSELLKLADKFPECNVFHARKDEKDERTGKMTDTPAWPEHESHDDFVKHYFDNVRKHTISEFMYRTDAIAHKKFMAFPSGFYSDDASLIVFSKNGGVASSSIPLLTFRFSNEHITSNGKYNIGKAKAMKHFLRWLENEPSCKPYYSKKKKDELDAAIEYFVQCPGWEKILVLPYIPWTKSNLRIAWIVLVQMLLGKRKQ